jgi:opacity protein-like surface antigen
MAPRPRPTPATTIPLLALLLIAATARAQSESAYPAVGVGGNVGFQKLGSSNGLFEIGAEISLHLNEHFSVGPWLQVGTSQDIVNVLFTANARWHFDFMERTRFRRLRPFVQGGLGLAHTTASGAKATDFVLNMGLGAEVPVSDHVSLGSDVMFNPILTRPAGSNWAFSWQFLTVRYRF